MCGATFCREQAASGGPTGWSQYCLGTQKQSPGHACCSSRCCNNGILMTLYHRQVQHPKPFPLPCPLFSLPELQDLFSVQTCCRSVPTIGRQNSQAPSAPPSPPIPHFSPPPPLSMIASVPDAFTVYNSLLQHSVQIVLCHRLTTAGGSNRPADYPGHL